MTIEKCFFCVIFYENSPIWIKSLVNMLSGTIPKWKRQINSVSAQISIKFVNSAEILLNFFIYWPKEKRAHKKQSSQHQSCFYGMYDFGKKRHKKNFNDEYLCKFFAHCSIGYEKSPWTLKSLQYNDFYHILLSDWSIRLFDLFCELLWNIWHFDKRYFFLSFFSIFVTEKRLWRNYWKKKRHRSLLVYFFFRHSYTLFCVAVLFDHKLITVLFNEFQDRLLINLLGYYDGSVAKKNRRGEIVLWAEKLKIESCK